VTNETDPPGPQQRPSSAICSAPMRSCTASPTGSPNATSGCSSPRARTGPRLRDSVLATHADRRQRELHKLAEFADVMPTALRGRGVAQLRARLAAERGVVAFKVVFARWVEQVQPAPGLQQVLREVMTELRETVLSLGRRSASLPARRAHRAGRARRSKGLPETGTRT